MIYRFRFFVNIFLKDNDLLVRVQYILGYALNLVADLGRYYMHKHVPDVPNKDR